jgi:hypothetical protein
MRKAPALSVHLPATGYLSAADVPLWIPNVERFEQKSKCGNFETSNEISWNGPDSSAHLGPIATVLSYNFFGARQVAPRMVKLAALRLAPAKNVSKSRDGMQRCVLRCPFLS